MPITRYSTDESGYMSCEEIAFPGEMSFKDYFTGFAGVGVLHGYKPNVELDMERRGLIRHTPQMQAYLRTVEDEVLSYFSGGPVSGHKTVRYKAYTGGSYHVSPTCSGVYLFFLHDADRAAFIKAMNGAFVAITKVDAENEGYTHVRIKEGYRPETKSLRAYYDGLIAKTAAEAPADPEAIAAAARDVSSFVGLAMTAPKPRQRIKAGTDAAGSKYVTQPSIPAAPSV